MKAQKQIKTVEFFEELNNAVKGLVKECILEAASNRGGPEGWKSEEECLDSIECHSRDGFIASAHNRGGIIYRNFATLMDYWSGGYTALTGVPPKKLSAKSIIALIVFQSILSKNLKIISKQKI